MPDIDIKQVKDSFSNFQRFLYANEQVEVDDLKNIGRWLDEKEARYGFKIFEQLQKELPKDVSEQQHDNINLEPLRDFLSTLKNRADSQEHITLGLLYLQWHMGIFPDYIQAEIDYEKKCTQLDQEEHKSKETLRKIKDRIAEIPEELKVLEEAHKKASGEFNSLEILCREGKNDIDNVSNDLSVLEKAIDTTKKEIDSCKEELQGTQLDIDKLNKQITEKKDEKSRVKAEKKEKVKANKRAKESEISSINTFLYELKDVLFHVGENTGKLLTEEKEWLENLEVNSNASFEVKIELMRQLMANTYGYVEKLLHQKESFSASFMHTVEVFLQPELNKAVPNKQLHSQLLSMQIKIEERQKHCKRDVELYEAGEAAIKSLGIEIIKLDKIINTLTKIKENHELTLQSQRLTIAEKKDSLKKPELKHKQLSQNLEAYQKELNENETSRDNKNKTLTQLKAQKESLEKDQQAQGKKRDEAKSALDSLPKEKKQANKKLQAVADGYIQEMGNVRDIASCQMMCKKFSTKLDPDKNQESVKKALEKLKQVKLSIKEYTFQGSSVEGKLKDSLCQLNSSLKDSDFKNYLEHADIKIKEFVNIIIMHIRSWLRLSQDPRHSLDPEYKHPFFQPPKQVLTHDLYYVGDKIQQRAFALS